MTSSTLLYLGKASEFALRSTFGASKIISTCGDCADPNAAPRSHPEVIPKLSRGYPVIAQSRLFFLSQSEQKEPKEKNSTSCWLVSHSATLPLCHSVTHFRHKTLSKRASDAIFQEGTPVLQEWEKASKRGFRVPFWGLLERKNVRNYPFSRFKICWTGNLLTLYLVVYLLFRELLIPQILQPYSLTVEFLKVCILLISYLYIYILGIYII